MRLSLRKVVKLTTFLFAFMLLNVWVSYNVNLWSFNNFEDRGKVVQSYATRGRRVAGDNGGAFSVPSANGPTAAPGKVQAPVVIPDFDLSKNKRSAKAFEGNLDYFEDANDRKTLKKSIQGSRVVDSGARSRPGRRGNSRPSALKPKNDAPTQLKDIFISVKTTAKYHKTRIKLIEKTWFALARTETFFFTDSDDKDLNRDLGGHLINTNCTTDHSRRALSCKMAVEIDFYLASRKRWFCHLDDDVYLNVQRLLELLQRYNHKEDWYLGKPSLKHPLEVIDRNNPGMKLAFWFATGGAGFCISRSLALKMVPYAGGGRFMTTAEQIRLPDDCTIGYIIEHLLKKRLTVIDLFHSHLEALWLIKKHQLDKQITFSYSKYSGKRNVLNVDGFNDQEDPTRLKSLHCRLFPTFRDCQGLPVPED